MNLFQKMCEMKITCDICGKEMHPLYGGGFDNDRIMCSDSWVCGAEIVFPTSTPVNEDEK